MERHGNAPLPPLWADVWEKARDVSVSALIPLIRAHSILPRPYFPHRNRAQLDNHGRSQKYADWLRAQPSPSPLQQQPVSLPRQQPQRMPPATSTGPADYEMMMEQPHEEEVVIEQTAEEEDVVMGDTLRLKTFMDVAAQQFHTSLQNYYQISVPAALVRATTAQARSLLAQFKRGVGGDVSATPANAALLGTVARSVAFGIVPSTSGKSVDEQVFNLFPAEVVKLKETATGAGATFLDRLLTPQLCHQVAIPLVSFLLTTLGSDGAERKQLVAYLTELESAATKTAKPDPLYPLLRGLIARLNATEEAKLPTPACDLHRDSADEKRLRFVPYCPSVSCTGFGLRLSDAAAKELLGKQCNSDLKQRALFQLCPDLEQQQRSGFEFKYVTVTGAMAVLLYARPAEPGENSQQSETWELRRDMAWRPMDLDRETLYVPIDTGKWGSRAHGQELDKNDRLHPLPRPDVKWNKGTINEPVRQYARDRAKLLQRPQHRAAANAMAEMAEAGRERGGRFQQLRLAFNSVGTRVELEMCDESLAMQAKKTWGLKSVYGTIARKIVMPNAKRSNGGEFKRTVVIVGNGSTTGGWQAYGLTGVCKQLVLLAQVVWTPEVNSSALCHGCHNPLSDR